MEKCKVQLINYFDVWGNEEDGYEVNNLCKEGEPFDLPKGFTDEQLLEALKEMEFFNNRATLETVRFEDLHDFGVEFYVARTGEPVGRVEIL